MKYNDDEDMRILKQLALAVVAIVLCLFAVVAMLDAMDIEKAILGAIRQLGEAWRGE